MTEYYARVGGGRDAREHNVGNARPSLRESRAIFVGWGVQVQNIPVA